MKFTASLTSNDPLADAAQAVLEAKYGPQSPANKLAWAKMHVKEYKRNLKDAIDDKKDAETIAFWKKRLEGAMKELAALTTKNEDVEIVEVITKYQKQMYASWKKMSDSQLSSERQKLAKYRDGLTSPSDKALVSDDIRRLDALLSSRGKNEEYIDEAVTRNDLRKRYNGAYLSALDLEDYPPRFQKTANDFAKDHGLKQNEVAVVHDEGIGHVKFKAMQTVLKSLKIPFVIWIDSTNSGEHVCFFSLKESTVSEARINGFQANRAVVNAQENLARVKTTFLPTSILARTVAQDVGPGVKADFEKITKLLEQVEDIWEGIYMEGSMAYDANINK